MSSQNPSDILESLLKLGETEWIEFKRNNAKPEEIGANISAVSNAASLHERDEAYIIWGIDDQSRKVVGSTFEGRAKRVGNEEIENWLATQLEPRIDFKIHEFDYQGLPVVLFAIQPCPGRPVAFRGVASIRVGSYTKKLSEHPEKERALWIKGKQGSFEREVAAREVSATEVMSLLDWPQYFKLMAQPEPLDPAAVLDRLESEKLIVRTGSDRWNITNQGALLFARNLRSFDSLSRKAVRVIRYRGRDRIHTLKERPDDSPGYAVGFQSLVRYINDQLPTNEQIDLALRRQVPMYPELAIRELVANAIIHQDLRSRGTSPMVEIFSDRIEITNPGQPLISTLRFLDQPPQSRNEGLAGLMRRLSICEERGSGIDKVIFEAEFFQLPAPDFSDGENHTKAVLYAPRKFSEMQRQDKVRACYQHACLMHVSHQPMTNATLRARFSIEERNYSIASRIIRETIRLSLIRPADPENKSRKHATYVPFWA